jgi:histidinol-phosphate aminotransferase
MERRDFLRMGAGLAGGAALFPLAGVPGPTTWSGAREALAAGARPADGIVRLSSNENPMGVPESAREAIVRAFGEAHHYPGAAIQTLRRALAEHHGIEPSGILLGCGSTEVLQMAVQSRIRPGLRVVVPDPTFEDVHRYVLPHVGEVEVVRVPLVPGSFAHDLRAMEERAREATGPCVVYVCNPNNPTGTLTPVAPIRAWIDRSPDLFFLVDEAYVEYAEDPVYEPLDRLAWERRNVVVARTFSKVYGLAGIRVGYSVAHPETTERMRLFATPTNPGQPACVAALAALADRDYVERGLEVNRRSRGIVLQVLDELNLSSMPSQTNFVLHRIQGELELYRQRMAEAGFLVGRAFPPYLDHNRVSLGLPQEMERWAEALRGFRARGWV